MQTYVNQKPKASSEGVEIISYFFLFFIQLLIFLPGTSNAILLFFPWVGAFISSFPLCFFLFLVYLDLFVYSVPIQCLFSFWAAVLNYLIVVLLLYCKVHRTSIMFDLILLCPKYLLPYVVLTFLMNE